MEQNKQQETFLQTLQAQIERSKKTGSIEELFQPSGFDKVLPIQFSPLVKYFTSLEQSVDEYGKITDAQPKE